MEKFKVGDRVRIRQWADMEKEFGLDAAGDINCKYWFTHLMRHLCGRTASVISVAASEQVALDFDDKSGITCWSYSTDMIEPIKTKQETIVIYRNGDIVTALDKRDGRKATAKCSPDDTFDFEVGARLAFDRLMGKTKPKTEQKPKWYNGQIVCVKGLEDEFTVGKVYQVNDGMFIDDKGHERPTTERLSSPTSFNGCLWKFIEYKGGAK